jgi:hypothetical protein
MLPKNCGQLLYNAVRETLETMAFAEVIPCSIKVGGEEFARSNDDTFDVGPGVTGPPPAGTSDPLDTWGNIAPNISDNDSWGDPVPNSSAAPIETETSADDAWGSVSPEPLANDAWGELDSNTETDDDDNESWGKSGIIAPPNSDPWNDSSILTSQTATKPNETDFDDLVSQQNEWCWACMKVNSPDVHSVWFIVSKGLANALAQNMYAGEEFQLDNPLIRDLIAELTNVLGGRLMLLLEELGGKFTLTVPEIGFGLPEVPEQSYETAICKVVVDGEHPVMVALCFNQGGILSP